MGAEGSDVRAAAVPDFKALGRPVSGPSRDLETFPAPAHVAEVTFTSDELTSHCPVTHQPDFYTVEIRYRPTELCLESKSLKRYLWSFRDEAMFAETLASVMARDVVGATRASHCRVTLRQHVRGGLRLEAVAEIGA
ncbi:preQ(1) synthase [bacterium]|nr:preQ(1) synthase [Chloroflexi bacterium CFX6]RIL12337.1 MAG: preQ(1) synthase [bacterium]